MPDFKKGGQPICGRKVKVCRKCQYRYPKGDKALACSKCGETRFCQSTKVRGLDTCRMHGDHKKAHEPKFLLGPNLSKRVNRILNHPELFDLANEFAANEARMEELLQIADEFSYAQWGIEMDRAIQNAERSVKFGERAAVLLALENIAELRKKELQHVYTWAEYRECVKLSELLVRSRHSMQIETQAMVSVTQLVEIISAVQRVIFKVIKNPTDRKYIIEELRSFYGSPDEARNSD